MPQTGRDAGHRPGETAGQHRSSGAPARSRANAPRQLGPFVLEAQIGEGAQAVVYRAIQVSLRRPVALKILSPALAASDPDFTDRFLQEARLAAKLRHPNIVRVIDSGVDQGFHWLAMELVDGDTLDAVIKRHGRLREPNALAITRDLASALHGAAQEGILHRDVKPQNVLVTRDGTPTLSDLGMAKEHGHVSHQTTTGFVVGTPQYMSPEQVLGRREIDIRSDLYSAGIMLFYMLTGQVPLTDESAVSTMLRHAQEEVPSVRSVDPKLSAEVDAICRLLTERDRELRYPDAATLEHDCITVLQGRPPPHATRALRRRSASGPAVEPGRSPAAEDDALPPLRAPRPRETTRLLWLILLVAAGGLIAGVLIGVAAGMGGGAGAEPVTAAAAASDPTSPAGGPEGTGGLDDDDDAGAAIDLGLIRTAPEASAGFTRVAPPADAAAREMRLFVQRLGEVAGPLMQYRRVPRPERLARYRSLGVGADLDRLERGLMGVEAEAQSTLWRYAAVDRAIEMDRAGVERALHQRALASVRMPERYGRGSSSYWLQRMEHRVHAISEIIELGLARPPPSARERFERALPQDENEQRAIQYFEEAGLMVLRGMIEVRSLVPALIRGGDDSGDPLPATELRRILDDPAALTAERDRRVAAVEEHLPRCPSEAIRARAAEIIRTVDMTIGDASAEAVLYLRGSQPDAAFAFRAQPLEAWTVNDFGGVIQDAEAARGREVFLEIGDIRRFRVASLELASGESLRAGLELRDGDRPVAFAIIEAAGQPRMGRGALPLGELRARPVAAAGAPRTAASVQLLVVTDQDRLELGFQQIRLSAPFLEGLGGLGPDLSLRIHLTSTTALTGVLLQLRHR